jgi:uncharacterized protein (TIGR02145 family)
MKNILSVLTLLTVLISSGFAQDTVQVKTGWNIIGSVKAGVVPDVLSTIPPGIISTAFYGYSPGSGYQSTDTLDKGFGYWVKVNADGIIIFNTSSSDECGIKRVDIGGFSYGTVPIHGQCWLEENLNVGTMVTGVASQTNNGTLEKYCYYSNPANCGLYGGLYQWNEAMQYSTVPGTRGICPPGWHIPTLVEFQTLSSNVSGDGSALKAVGQGTSVGAGTNTSGFSALLAGIRYANDGSFGSVGSGAYSWSSTEFDATSAGYIYLNFNESYVTIGDNAYKEGGLSVRCLED